MRKMDSIKIERREIVAEVETNTKGQHDPLKAAFMAVSEAITTNEPDTLEFEFEGIGFVVQSKPLPESGPNGTWSDEDMSAYLRNRGFSVYPSDVYVEEAPEA